MGKLKELREARATVFAAIDELRKATDGREMTAEEQQRWDALLADYDKADRKVEQEERFEELERRQAEQSCERRHATDGNDDPAEYRSAFVEYLLKGENGVSAENRRRFEQRERSASMHKAIRLADGVGDGKLRPHERGARLGKGDTQQLVEIHRKALLRLLDKLSRYLAISPARGDRCRRGACGAPRARARGE